MQDSLLESQETVIELQKELLECKDGQLQSVEKVVKSEIRSYSEAVESAKGPKTASVSVKEVQKVVQNVVEAEDRSKNIIFFGLKEADDEDINVIIDEALEIVGCKPRHESVRIGFKKQTEPDSNKHRPVKVSVASSAHVMAILRSAKRLKSVERFKNVFISPDRTTEERKSRREAVALLRKKTLDNPDKRFFIRNNKVLSDKDLQSSVFVSCDIALCVFDFANSIFLMMHIWWSGTKTLKTTTANTDIKLSSGGEAPHLATIEQPNLVFE